MPLWIAFALGRLGPSRRFPFGYGRAEDLAGVIVVLIILFSAVVAGYQSHRELIHPQPVGLLWAVAVAGTVGFLNSKRWPSSASRWAGRSAARRLWPTATMPGSTAGLAWLSSLVLPGCVGATRRPIVGLLIAVAILVIVWQSGKTVFTHGRGGSYSARRDPQCGGPRRGRARCGGGAGWVVGPPAARGGQRGGGGSDLSVAEGHAIAREVNHRLLHELRYLDMAVVHVDPVQEFGEEYHRISTHRHNGLPPHSHL